MRLNKKFYQPPKLTIYGTVFDVIQWYSSSQTSSNRTVTVSAEESKGKDNRLSTTSLTVPYIEREIGYSF